MDYDKCRSWHKLPTLTTQCWIGVKLLERLLSAKIQRGEPVYVQKLVYLPYRGSYYSSNKIHCHTFLLFTRREAFMSMKIYIVVFRVVTPCNVRNYWRKGEICCLHLHRNVRNQFLHKIKNHLRDYECTVRYPEVYVFTAYQF